MKGNKQECDKQTNNVGLPVCNQIAVSPSPPEWNEIFRYNNFLIRIDAARDLLLHVRPPVGIYVQMSVLFPVETRCADWAN